VRTSHFLAFSLAFFLASAALLAQQPTGPFRPPGSTAPPGNVSLYVLKGSAFNIGAVGFINLTGTLDAITGDPGDCIHVDGSSGPCGSDSGGSLTGNLFSGAEKPGGTLNGVNTIFTLAAAPSPAISLALFRNGQLEAAGSDYTLSGATITFLPGAIPQSTDLLQAYYNVAAIGSVSLTGTPSPGQVPTAINGTSASWQTPAGGGVWGSITGTLSNQTDLATELATFLTKANNLSDLANAATARTNLGLGTAAVTALVTSVGSPGLDTNVPSEKAVRTALGMISGGGPQTFECNFVTRDDTQGNWGSCGATFHGVSIIGPADSNHPGFYDFPSAGGGYVVLHHMLPASWVSAAGILLQLFWAPASNGSGNVEWQVSTTCSGAGIALYNNAPTYNAAQTVTTAVTGSTVYQNYTSTISALTLTGCAVGQWFDVKIANAASGSGSTFTADEYVYGALLQVTQ
jgi:hypothetical protein